MSVDDWDVEKHKTEHECDEHWELRRKFLLAHKTKFPEDELVCLAQVFCNIELLGCRYPTETMDLVAELSEEIAAEFREKQKTKLKRTFVKASEAASSKVKGCTPQTSTIIEEPIMKKIDKANKKSESLTQKEIDNRSKNQITQINNRKRRKRSNEESSSKKETKSSKKETNNSDLPYGDIVLLERSGDVPQSVLASSINASGNCMEWKCTKSDNLCNCAIYINSRQVACASGGNQKIARKEAAAIALNKLRKYYYTIKVKQTLEAQTSITMTTIENTESQEDIPDNNIGKKLMKLMGWSGGGLGKSQQGIMEPVTLKQQLSRQGLGLKSSSSDLRKLKIKCKSKFKEFLMGNMQNDIVFSTDFTNDERSMIHQVARAMGLKSRSYGPSNQRKLVISRKIDMQSLVEELKNLGGTNEKYELIEPTG